MTIAIKAIVICPPLLEKKPPALGLLFGIVMTFSIIETSLRGAATQPVEPPACFCARLRVHRCKQNSEKCAVQRNDATRGSICTSIIALPQIWHSGAE
jgi:hypothetical protein